MKLLHVVLVVVIAGAAACGGDTPPEPSAAARPAAAPVSMPAIDGNAVLEHAKVLASDAYEGRAPGTKGEDLTVKYLEDTFKQIGLKPGNPDGTYVQKVPLVGITPDPAVALTFTKGSQKQALKYADRLRRVDQTRRRHRGSVGLRARVRRVRRGGARVRLGRLQGR